jgi:hypothetical protein
MKHYLTKSVRYLARFLQVQLFLSLVSLPILVSWGLPLSMMTAVGNFLFSPFLALFLLCSSLIFFTELLGIPNSWLIIVLEKVTTLWSTCLSWGSKSWLVGFYKPSLIFLLLITFVAFLIMQHKKLGKLYPSIACLSLLLCVTTSYLVYSRPRLNLFHVACGKHQVMVMTKQNKVVIKDNGAFSKKLSPDSWVQFTLLPELTKRTGKTTVCQVVVTNPNTLTFQALTSLCKHAQVKSIELPYWDKEQTKAGWHAFFELKRTIEQEKVQIKRIPLQI